ncbi:MAG: DinB family protein [Candidatus Zixiibacteriota bacterium]
MIPELEGLAPIFRTAHQLFHRALDGITESRARERRDGANPILWIAGHVVAIRAGFLKFLGVPIDIPWAKYFPRGGQVKDEASWPSLNQVRAKWDEVQAAFMSRLERLTSEQIRATTEGPSLDDSVLGTLSLAALHDTYHVGQLAAARRRYGLDRIVG